MRARAALPLLMLLAVASCNRDDPPKSIATATFHGQLPGTRGLIHPDVVFVPSAHVLGLTTAGSSSCPWTPVKLAVSGPSSLVIQVRSHRAVCTADASVTSFLLNVPESLTGTQIKVEVDFGDRSEHVVARTLASVPTGPEATTG